MSVWVAGMCANTGGVSIRVEVIEGVFGIKNGVCFGFAYNFGFTELLFD